MSNPSAPTVASDAVGLPPGTPPATPPVADPLRRMRRIGYWLLALQLACFLAWSAVLYGHFALTWDFATYNQPWYLVAHGNLNPYSTVSRIPFWQNDAEFMPWLLAPFYWLFRNGVTLLWLQDLSIVAAEAVAFSWICEVAGQRCRPRDAKLLAGLGVLLFVANPWVWWAVSNDVHEEPLVMAFVVLLARDLAGGRRRAWAWLVPVLLGGAPTTSYVIGLGVGGLLTRRTRAMGAAVALTGVGYSLLIVAAHGDVGVPLPRHFGYLATADGHVPPVLTFSGLVTGIASHPLNIVKALWAKRVDVIANMAPSGALGACAPIMMPVLLVVLLENTLSLDYRFSEPLFQSIPVYVLTPVGTVMVLAWLLQRHRRTAIAVGAFLAAQVLGWAVVWGPVTPGQWLRVPGSTATTLDNIAARIPPAAEVVASQGITGPFSSRVYVYPLTGIPTIPIHARTWFVIAPQAGTELMFPATSKALIGELAGPLNATPITHADGIWAFAWSPPPGVDSLAMPGGMPPIPAWTSAGAAGRAVVTGPESNWRVVATGARGYVADQIEWVAPPARYVAAVTLSAGGGPVNVEIWNNTGNVLLARKTITSTAGAQTITLPVDARTRYQATPYSGWGPFRADFVPPPPGERLEVRVWSPGSTAVSVYSADISPAPSPGR